MSQKDMAGAEEVLKKMADASPGKVEPVLALGVFYISVRRPADAEQQLRRALEIDPKSGLALVSLAGMKLRAGLRDEAEQLYKQAASASDPRYRPTYAFFLFQTGKRDLAIAEFERLAKADPCGPPSPEHPGCGLSDHDAGSGCREDSADGASEEPEGYRRLDSAQPDSVAEG